MRPKMPFFLVFKEHHPLSFFRCGVDVLGVTGGLFRVVNLTRLRTFAAKGKNGHGPVQVSGTAATLFAGFSAKNVDGEL
ncbi:hypothetical protein [Klebsiella sp. PL-2018]|uniref:hypothetical protein n=1 Tax=Klebsiella sp. PL-2018 TaxID=2851540 RepID=UPI001C24B499|nr:hypothetical protein [Klebsiella sp. PL-2018]